MDCRIPLLVLLLILPAIVSATPPKITPMPAIEFQCCSAFMNNRPLDAVRQNLTLTSDYCQQVIYEWQQNLPSEGIPMAYGNQSSQIIFLLVFAGVIIVIAWFLSRNRIRSRFKK